MKDVSYVEKAVALRKAGYSYALIQKKVPVARSTLSRWLRDVPFVPNKEVEDRIGIALSKAIAAKHAQKIASYKQAKVLAQNDFDKTNNKLLYLGLGLYMGEGEKNNNVGLANSDPQIIKLFITWLHDCYNVTADHLTLSVHAYADSNIDDCESYWSTVTGIPLTQFGKVQIDTRPKNNLMKRKRLPYGTAHVRVRSNGKKEFGVLLSRRIEESVKMLSEHIAGVM